MTPHPGCIVSALLSTGGMFVILTAAHGGTLISSGDCRSGLGVSTGNEAIVASAAQACGWDRGADARGSGSGAIVEWMDCGPAVQSGVISRTDATPCGALAFACEGTHVDPARPTTTMVALQQQPNGTWTEIGHDCAVPTTAAPPTISPAAARQALERLVPHPAVGIAPPGGVSLVNIQTLLWADTPVDQNLGTVTLLGQRVGLRVHVEQVRWDFGDGTSDVATTPGKKYDAADPCTAPRCADYYGHVYSATGSMKVAAQVVWSGEFSVGGGPWQPIAGVVTGPRLGTALIIEQARDVLVHDGRAAQN